MKSAFWIGLAAGSSAVAYGGRLGWFLAAAGFAIDRFAAVYQVHRCGIEAIDAARQDRDRSDAA